VADGAATAPEIAAADNVVATIPANTLPPLESADFINRFADAEYLLLKQKQQTDITGGNAGSTRLWDIVIGKNSLDMNSADAQTLKAQLVTDGILTQARADEIFNSTVASRKVRF
jgi:hypothetical protein